MFNKFLPQATAAQRNINCLQLHIGIPSTADWHTDSSSSTALVFSEEISIPERYIILCSNMIQAMAVYLAATTSRRQAMGHRVRAAILLSICGGSELWQGFRQCSPEGVRFDAVRA